MTRCSLGTIPEVPTPLARHAEDVDTLVTISDIEQRLRKISQILPISQSGLDVYSMVKTNESSSKQLAAAIERDPSLAAELLGLANSVFYNSSGTAIAELDLAVTRLGQRRVGDIALASVAALAITASKLPWMDLDLAWRRSVAAGVAVELMVEIGGHDSLADGLFLCGIMNSLGRVILGTLYPDHYQRILDQCQQSRDTLLVRENQVFPEDHANVLARLLDVWTVPSKISLPVKYILRSGFDVRRLAEPLRTKVELLKLALFIGRVACERWQPWDCVELPSAHRLERLRIKALPELLEQTVAESRRIVEFRVDRETFIEPRMPAADSDGHSRLYLPYCNLAATCAPENAFDFLATMLDSMGIEPLFTCLEDLEPTARALVNCTGLPPQSVSEQLRLLGGRNATLICEAQHADQYRFFGNVLSLPCSYEALRITCRQLGSPVVGALRASEPQPIGV